MQVFIQSRRKKEVVDITDSINELLEKKHIDNGVCVLFLKHTSAALTTADLDPGTDQDYLDAFDAIIPKLPYQHPHDPSHVGDHINAAMIGNSLTIPIQHGQLDLGVWQRVIMLEFNGPREREISVSVLDSIK
jgi:secondary thiamine-phosphate synthase enzyme